MGTLGNGCTCELRSGVEGYASVHGCARVQPRVDGKFASNQLQTFPHVDDAKSVAFDDFIGVEANARI